MRVSLLQMCSSDDPAANIAVLRDMVAQAVGEGADLIATPEVTNCVSLDRAHQNQVLQFEDDDQTIAAARELAVENKVWIALGSVGVKTGDADGRFANRSILVSPQGQIAARYDKIHMFDVAVTETETFRESAGYRPGAEAVVAQTPLAALGLSICYDLRFPHLYRALAKAGAQVLMVPAAFSPVTGAAHWEVLLRARAIETGCFVVAAAQTGTHPRNSGKERVTYGHSLVVAPWGDVLADGGTEPGIISVNLDPNEVSKARAKVPSLTHDRSFERP